MSVERFVADFVARLRADADRLRLYGASEAATATAHVAEQLTEAFQQWHLEALPISVAAAESGYSEDRLRELARDGKVPDARAPGDSRLRVRRCDLPQRPRDPVAEVDHLEARLLGGAR